MATTYAEKLHDIDSNPSMVENPKCSKTMMMVITILCCLVVAAGIVILVLFVVDIDKSDNSTPCNDRCTTNYTQYIQTIFNESQYWSDDAKTNYLKQFYKTPLGECIMEMNETNYKELRPDPSCYLPPNVIQHHLDMFRESGASGISNTKYAYYANFSVIGYGPDKVNTNGDQWISPYSIQETLLNECSQQTDPGDCVLHALGITVNQWDMFHYDWGNPTIINRVMQVHVLASSMDDLHLRMPSGNEEGVINSEWRPGGYTDNGTAEAIVDRISEGQYCWKAVTTPNGTFCYPYCQVICAANKGCLQTFC